MSSYLFAVGSRSLFHERDFPLKGNGTRCQVSTDPTRRASGRSLAGILELRHSLAADSRTRGGHDDARPDAIEVELSLRSHRDSTDNGDTRENRQGSDDPPGPSSQQGRDREQAKQPREAETHP